MWENLESYFNINLDDTDPTLNNKYKIIRLGEMMENTEDVSQLRSSIDLIIEDVLQAPKVFIVINDNPKGGFAKKIDDEPPNFMEYGYCIEDEKVKKAGKADVQDKQFSRIFDNPFLDQQVLFQ